MDLSSILLHFLFLRETDREKKSSSLFQKKSHKEEQEEI